MFIKKRAQKDKHPDSPKSYDGLPVAEIPSAEFASRVGGSITKAGLELHGHAGSESYITLELFPEAAKTIAAVALSNSGIASPNEDLHREHQPMSQTVFMTHYSFDEKNTADSTGGLLRPRSFTIPGKEGATLTITPHDVRVTTTDTAESPQSTDPGMVETTLILSGSDGTSLQNYILTWKETYGQGSSTSIPVTPDSAAHKRYGDTFLQILKDLQGAIDTSQ